MVASHFGRPVTPLTQNAAAARLIDAVRPVLQNEARAFGLRSVAV
jgi:XRE family transcriptional regulator, aerobic/anaerobic benzoate catabolism transcriptional regulator